MISVLLTSYIFRKRGESEMGNVGHLERLLDTFNRISKMELKIRLAN